VALIVMNVTSMFQVGIEPHCDEELISHEPGCVLRLFGWVVVLLLFPGFGVFAGWISVSSSETSVLLESAVGLALGFPIAFMLARMLGVRTVACRHGVWIHRWIKARFVPWSEIATIGPPPGRFGPRGVVTTEGVFYAFFSTTNVGDFGWRHLYSDLNKLLDSSREAPDGLARFETSEGVE
jgi:hypothetical protein